MSEKENIGAIEGVEKLVNIFGYWPQFPGAEVVWIRLDRNPAGDSDYGPTLETLIHPFEMTSEVDSKGHCVPRHHVLVHLRFREVVDLRMEGFNHQNFLYGLNLVDIRDRQLERIKWRVRFESDFGVEASFQCLAIEVVSVEPCTKDGEPLQV